MAYVLRFWDPKSLGAHSGDRSICVFAYLTVLLGGHFSIFAYLTWFLRGHTLHGFWKLFPEWEIDFWKNIYHFYIDKVQCRKKSGIRIAFPKVTFKKTSIKWWSGSKNTFWGAKMEPGWLKMGPRWLKMEPRGAQDGAKMAPDGAKMGQDEPRWKKKEGRRKKEESARTKTNAEQKIYI